MRSCAWESGRIGADTMIAAPNDHNLCDHNASVWKPLTQQEVSFSGFLAPKSKNTLKSRRLSNPQTARNARKVPAAPATASIRVGHCAELPETPFLPSLVC
jgi:hypothetical protein